MRPSRDPPRRMGPGSGEPAWHSRNAQGSEYRAGIGQSPAGLNPRRSDTHGGRRRRRSPPCTKSRRSSLAIAIDANQDPGRAIMTAHRQGRGGGRLLIQPPRRLGVESRRVYRRSRESDARGRRPMRRFICQPGECWQMVYSRQMQATHCTETVRWTGRWRSPKGDRWWRVWACDDHFDGLTGLRRFGGSRV